MPISRDVHPPGFIPKLRRRLWFAPDGTVKKCQWQLNCKSNPTGHPELAWKAVDSILNSSIAEGLMEHRGFTHDPKMDIIEEGTRPDGFE